MAPPCSVAHLETVIRGRVVRGGDIERSGRLFGDHRVGDHRGGRGALGQVHPQPVARQHLGGGGGEVFRVEALVVADDNAAVLVPVGEQIGSEALAAAPDIGEGVIAGDLPAPAVRAEFDSLRHVSSQVVKYGVIIMEDGEV